MKIYDLIPTAKSMYSVKIGEVALVFVTNDVGRASMYLQLKDGYMDPVINGLTAHQLGQIARAAHSTIARLEERDGKGND